MRPSTIEHACVTLSGAGAGALAIVALADLGATYAGWPPVATRPGLASAAGIGAAMVAAGALGTLARAQSAVAAEGVLAALRASWTAREAALALALTVAAIAFAAGLAFDVRPRRVWALAAVTVLTAWALMTCTARARPGILPAAHVLAGHAAGAVLVEATVRPVSGPTWVAAAGVGLLVAALAAGEARNRADEGGPGAPGPWSRAVARSAAFAVPAVWLAAGLGDRGAGIAATIACLAGMAAARAADDRPSPARTDGA